MKENILAIPSRDKFRDETLNLLKDSGVQLDFSGRQLTGYATLPEIGKFKVVLMKPRDAIKAVEDGNISIGVVGEDVVRETECTWDGKFYKEKYSPVQQLLRLGIGRARLVIAAPLSLGLKTKEELETEVTNKQIPRMPTFGPFEQFKGLTIATGYPYLTMRELNAWTDDRDYPMNLECKYYEMTGSVETAPFIGLSDLISDLVETGDTLKANGLKEIATIFETEGILITNFANKKGSDPFVDVIRDRIFATLLERGNPDALRKQRRYEAFISSYR